MKYRTVALFILAAAATAAIPTALSRVQTLRAEVGNRVSVGVWNALLSLHGQKVAAPARTNVTQDWAAETAQAVNTVERVASAGAQKSEAASKKRAKAEADAPVVAEVEAVDFRMPEVELAKLDGLDKIIEVAQVARGPHTFHRADAPFPAAAPAASFAPRAQGGAPSPAVRISKEYQSLLVENVRQLTKGRKDLKEIAGKEVAGKWAAAERPGMRLLRRGDRRSDSYLFKFEQPTPPAAPEARAFNTAEGDTN